MIRLSKQEKKKIKYEAKRQQRKEQKKKNDLKKKQKRAEFLSSLTDSERKTFIDNEKQEKHLQESEQIRANTEAIPILLDMSYSSLMNEMEKSSLITQITQAVGFFKKCSTRHFRIICINTSQDMRERIESRGCKKWMIEISSEDFPNFTDSSKVVMLSPDAVDAIDDISKDKVYVIGGLVDRTRKKNFTLNKASERNLVALRLPIEEEAIVVRSI